MCSLFVDEPVERSETRLVELQPKAVVKCSRSAHLGIEFQGPHFNPLDLGFVPNGSYDANLDTVDSYIGAIAQCQHE
jgi:hypothetical protein